MQPDLHRATRRVAACGSNHLAREWDQVAEDRHRAIVDGQDPSYSHILLPTLRRLSADWLTPHSRVLDVGCGTGTFAHDLAAACPDCHITGVDPSPRSIEIAQAQPAPGNLQFVRSTVETFVAQAEPHRVDLVVANMLLQNVASLDDVLGACRRLLAPGGALVFAVPHPCFWPRHWRYEQAPWFRYDREIWIEAPFRTSRSPANGATTTHTHRPLEQYVRAFTAAGLAIDELAEPYPGEEVAGEYPAVWEFPRFLLARCRPGGSP